jgi:uncharacterized protein YgiM (DUF1202 family)
LLAFMAATAGAATAYISDELVLGVYAEQNGQGERLATLHSGASVETLSVNGEFTQVRLSDGTTGWVKSSYLTTREPATARLKQLQDELDRSRATTPALAEAAARSEVEQLKRELKAAQSDLDAARASAAAAPGVQADPAAAAAGGTGLESPRAAVPAQPGVLAAFLAHPLALALVLLLLLGGAFWAGYATLARRVRHKFGGLKVY